MTSRPLFISVDESTVIFGPIDQVGWASASSTVTAASSARVRPRNGPPLAVSTKPGHRRARSPLAAQALVDGAVLGVDRDDLGPGGAGGPAAPPGAPAMSDSLLASASRRPASRAASVTASPAKPTTPLTATSATAAMRGQRLGAGHDLDARGQEPGPARRRGPRRRWPRRRGGDVGPGRPAGRPTRLAPRATTSERLGLASTTSSAWVPMDPVDPIRLSARGRSWHAPSLTDVQAMLRARSR